MFRLPCLCLILTIGYSCLTHAIEAVSVEMMQSYDSSGLLDAGFPSDHLIKDGKPQWSGWFYPGIAFPPNEIERRYYQAYQTYGGGFSPMLNLYIRFNQPKLKIESICTNDCASTPSIELIDLTTGTNKHGPSLLFTMTFHPLKIDDLESILQVRPTGPLLQEKHTYALVVYNHFLKPPYILQQSRTLRKLLSEEASGAPTQAHRAFKPLRNHLVIHKKDPAQIAAALVWTTGSPTQPLRNYTQQVIKEKSLYISDFEIEGPDESQSTEDFCIIKGHWQAPLFVDGMAPRYFFEGGLKLNDDGKVQTSDTRSADFYISIPRIPLPEQGFPLIIYSQGTAGRANQFRLRGQTLEKGATDYLTRARPGNIAEAASTQGFAVASMANYLGAEYCEQEASYFQHSDFCPLVAYNPATPSTMVASFYQMVLERVLFRRLMNSITIPQDKLCEGMVPRPVHFDKNRQVAMGQSLGAMVAGASAATDMKPFQGLILTGAGNYGLGLALRYGGFPLNYQEAFWFWEKPGKVINNPFHPVWSMAEMGLSTANVALHLNRWIHSPTFKTHVLVIEGTFDTRVASPMQLELLRGLEADFAGAEPEDIPDSVRLLPDIRQYGGNQYACVRMNRKNHFTNQLYSVGVVQYPRDDILSGHHVTFQRPEAREQYSRFLRAIREDKSPIIGLRECRQNENDWIQ